MIKIENFEVIGWEHAIRGLRNPMNSWDKSDSVACKEKTDCRGCPMNNRQGHCNNPGGFGTLTIIGPNDHELMMKLRKAGTDHRKFMRMITVYVDITAPLYWWKEFDTYKVGTVANSCSTMHKIHAKEFTLEDFSCEHLLYDDFAHDKACPVNAGIYFESGTPIDEKFEWRTFFSPMRTLELTISVLNMNRKAFLETNDKKYWYQMIQLLPTSYNQRRTVMLNYEVLANIYKSRKNHKLDEWREFCTWIEQLPYSELIIGEVESNE